MKFLLPIALGVLLISGCTSSQNTLPPLSSVKPGLAAEGTLANEKLIADASKAVFKIVGHSGKGKVITKFVVQKPVGPAGARAWREIWIYDIEGSNQAFIMTFKEAGVSSAVFEIRKFNRL